MMRRWHFFGIVCAALVQMAVSTELFTSWLGAPLLNLFTTRAAVMITGVYLEGAVPLAADLMRGRRRRACFHHL